MHIHEVVVVEGRSDTQRLKQFFDCDTIETRGSHVTGEILERIAAAQRERGVIVFTDPDASGEHIRSIISRRIPGVKHAYIDREKAKTPRKVGVEHAAKADLEDSLAHLITYDERLHTLEWDEFIDLGLIGDASRRKQVCDAFHIGKCNAKTCFKRLNQMGVTKNRIEEVL
ncbi:ribonuclease M5 [Allobaculum mucilyticum]|uniref:ribonuclease M5 n=1 Tax=Allobaculum mucilyticum TaxID=2834459 RepID=UPI001E406AA8|nr:ribonuclease M5 [Allobaculum mucilyticum]UNT95055.1 ribonuclease M5 [Allobaculum mucilyticum]